MSEDLVLEPGGPNPLRQMITVLESHGWVQNTLVDFNPGRPPRVCLLGAAGYVGAQDYEYYEQCEDDEELPTWLLMLGETIAEQFPDRASALTSPWVLERIPLFNDDASTSLDEVLAVCEKAAIRWEETR